LSVQNSAIPIASRPPAGRLLQKECRSASHLQMLDANFTCRWRYDTSLWRSGSIGDGVNHPPPAHIAISVDSPGCAAAFVNLHSPVVAVSRKCERISECGRVCASSFYSAQSFTLSSVSTTRAVKFCSLTREQFRAPSPRENVVLWLPSCRNENRQVLKRIDTTIGRIDHHRGASGMS